MYKYCKQIVKLNQVPAVITKNINVDIQFKKEFELSTQLIILNEEIQKRDNHRDFYSSIIGGVLVSLGIYSVYEVYFSKSEKQLLKFKLSAQCYMKSFYEKDLNYIVTFFKDIKDNEIKNTGFVVYLLQTLKINKANFNQLCTIFNEASQILLSHEIYLNTYAKKTSTKFGQLLDFAISNDLPLKNEMALPSLISYLYSENILVEIQSLYILTQFKIQEDQYINRLKDKINQDIKVTYIETNELFEMLINQSTPEGYDEFKDKYFNTLQSEKQKLLKLVALKQNL